MGLGNSPAWAVELTGTLFDEEMQTPIEAAKVVVRTEAGEVVRTQSNFEGAFRLDVPEGPGSLEVYATEYQNLTVSYVAIEGMTPLDLTMVPYEVGEVVVVYYDEPDPIVTTRTLTSAEVARVPGGFGDPVRVVTSLPGAARPPFGSSQLIIRGGNDDDTTVLIDGVEVPIVYHVGGYRSVIHPSMVAQVDFLPGIFPSRYGDTTSGVVDIQTRADWSDEWELTAQADLLDASASFRGALGKNDAVGVAGAIRRSYVDLVLAPLANDFVLPAWFDYQVQFQTLNTSPHTFRLIAFGLNDRIGTDDSDFGITSTTTSHRAVASWVYEPSNRFKLLVQPAVGWDNDQVGLGTAVSVIEQGIRTGLRAEARWTPNPMWVVVGGAQIQGSNLEIDATLPFDPTAGDPNQAFEATDARWVTQPDPYAEVQLRPLRDEKRLVMSAGLRAESMFRQGLDPEFGLSPRGSVRFNVVEGSTLKGGVGLSHQMPSAQALAFSPDTPLALERALTAEVGFEQKLGDVATFDAVAYGRSMSNIAIQQFGAPAFMNDGIGRAYGLEFLLRKEPTGPLFGWISYSLSRSERIDDPEASDDWVLFGLDQTHNLIAIAGYQLRKGWDFGFRFQYTSGNPFTPYEGGIFELSDGTYTGIPSGDVNSGRLDPYMALDLRVSKTFNFRRGQAKIYLDLLNVITGENPEFLIDAYDFSSATPVSGLPFLPSPGLQLDLRL